MAAINLTDAVINSDLAEFVFLLPKDSEIMGLLVLKKGEELYDPYVEIKKGITGLEMEFSKTDHQILTQYDFLRGIFSKLKSEG